MNQSLTLAFLVAAGIGLVVQNTLMVCITQSSSPRAIPAGELSTLAIDAGWPEADIHVTENLEDAIEWSVGRAEAGNDLSGGVLVTGSITLVGEISLLLKRGDS